MPLLRFGKERLDPDLAFAHGLSVGLRRVVAPDPVEVGLVEAAADPPAAWRGRALLLERTGLAGCRWRLVDPAMGRLALREEAQHRPAGAAVDVCCGVVAEVLLAEYPRPLADLRQREIGPDALVLERDDGLDRAVLGVGGHLPRPQFPPEPRPPEEVERRLVLLHLGRRH